MSLPPIPLRRPIRRTAYQLCAEINSKDTSPAECYDASIVLIQNWLRSKLITFSEVSSLLEKGDEDWDIQVISGHTIRSIHHDWERQSRKWALRFTHPDSSVPTQIWDVQAVVSLAGDTVQLSVDVSYSVAVEADAPIHPVPGFVGQIAEQVGLSVCGISLRTSPYQVGIDLEVSQLVDLLTHPQRSLPVLVLSTPDKNKWIFSERAPEYLVSGEELAKRCFGMCVVVELPYWRAFDFSKKVGRNWSVFDGGVRLYRPGLDFDEDGIYSHPLFLKSDIMTWPRRDFGSVQFAFERYLNHRINTSPVFFPRNCEHASFSQILQDHLEHERVVAHLDVKRRQNLYEAQIEALKREVKEQRDTAESIYLDSLELEEKVSKYQEDIHNLSLYNDTLLHAMRASGEDTQTLVPIPDNYEEMDEWCRRYFPDRLLFTTRARRAIKDPSTLYENVSLVFQCLMLLANEYRDMKRGYLEVAAFEERCKILQVENRPSASKTQAGMAKEEYYIDVNGKRHLLDMHIVRGKGRDPHGLLRIYYYWDEDEEKVVIGSLTNHLTTQAT